jgi:hypothetical protein
MSISKIKTGSITTDAITEAKVADVAIESEHLNTNIVTGQTELAEAASSNDILLVYDASSGTLKKILASNVGTQAVTLSSVSPTNALSGDGTGNFTFTITGTNLTGASAVLVTDGGIEVNFDSVTVDSATQITAVIAKSSITTANEPYDVKVYGSNGLTAILRDQINVDASPAFVTASGSLGTQLINTAGSFSVNATDPDSAGNVTFELQSGSLPPGYSITNTAAEGGTAIIAGTDSTTSSSTTFNFVLRAVDAASNTSSRSFSITSRAIVSESFTSDGTFSVPSGVTALDVLVVGGGGGGGAPSPVPSAIMQAGGGGAGGLVFFPCYPVTSSGTITVTVGNGGPRANANTGQPGSDGSDSAFGSPSDPGLGQGGVLTAKGGGGGGASCSQHDQDGRTGGSGGGGGGRDQNPGGGQGASATQPTQPGNSGSYGFGNPGGNAQGNGGGGGGGGAQQAGLPAGQGGNAQGGNGRAYTIADGTTPVYYAGGGGGADPSDINSGPTASEGGLGGGGPGGRANVDRGSGEANKGGGGGGGSEFGTGGDGGKGVVIVRY